VVAHQDAGACVSRLRVLGDGSPTWRARATAGIDRDRLCCQPGRRGPMIISSEERGTATPPRFEWEGVFWGPHPQILNDGRENERMTRATRRRLRTWFLCCEVCEDEIVVPEKVQLSFPGRVRLRGCESRPATLFGELAACPRTSGHCEDSRDDFRVICPSESSFANLFNVLEDPNQ
jgi:hypothetical protein